MTGPQMTAFASDVDIVVIQKQTALERYTRRALNVDFLEYVEQGGGSLDDLRESHDDHVAARRVVQNALSARGLTYVLWNLDELALRGLTPFRPSFAATPGTPGIRPRKGLVIALGGDGTLLHASHYVGEETLLLGVNSCPPHSVGALCAATAPTFSTLLDAALGGYATVVPTRRLLVGTSDGHALPLALNDLLLCNQHPAATSRYQISVVQECDPPSYGEGTCVPLRMEAQLSSGLWVAAPAGSSAVIRGYGLPQLPLDSHAFHLAVREPYVGMEERAFAPNGGYQLDRLTLNGDLESLSLFCRMRTGLVCVDGPDNGIRLGFGARVTISMPSETALRLIPRV
jgi:NAD+ kinase